MGENSKIEWTQHTFNPWTRCERVSPACDNCYAETWAGRAKHPADAAGKALPLWGADAPRDATSAHNWRQPVKWNEAARVAGVRARVFCASLADVFEDHPAITASGARERLWTLIEATPWLDWMLLTKRPENIMAMVPERWRKGLPVNVWIGCTAESQEWAEKRIPHLLKVPASVRFLSIEPMVGPVDLDPPTCPTCGGHDWVRDDGDYGSRHCCEHGDEMAFSAWLDPCADAKQAGINLVIVGGESGANARPLHPSWPLALRDQCVAAGVAFHFKQWGEYEPMMPAEAYRDGIEQMSEAREWKVMSDGVAIIHHNGKVEKLEVPPLLGRSRSATYAAFEQWWLDFANRDVDAARAAGVEDWPQGEEPWAMHYVGKNVAGRELDGRTWDEMPVVGGAL